MEPDGTSGPSGAQQTLPRDLRRAIAFENRPGRSSSFLFASLPRSPLQPFHVFVPVRVGTETPVPPDLNSNANLGHLSISGGLQSFIERLEITDISRTLPRYPSSPAVAARGNGPFPSSNEEERAPGRVNKIVDTRH